MNRINDITHVIIKEASLDELSLIQDALHKRRDILNAMEKSKFNVGDIVEWTGRKSGLKSTGRVNRVMKKNIKVIIDKNDARSGAKEIWHVPPSMLTKIASGLYAK